MRRRIPTGSANLRRVSTEILAGRPYTLHFPPDQAAAFGALADAEVLLTIKEAEILLTWKLTPGMFRAAPQLRWVHLGNAGVDNSLFPELVDSDVVLTNASGIHGAFMAEWALAALLYLTQAFRESDAWRHDRQWRLHKDATTPKRVSDRRLARADRRIRRGGAGDCAEIYGGGSALRGRGHLRAGSGDSAASADGAAARSSAVTTWSCSRCRTRKPRTT